MRRNVLAAVLLVCTFTASAQELRKGTKQLSVFLTEPSFTESSSTGSNVGGGAGIAFSYVFAPRWSAQVSVAAQEHRDVFTRFTTLITGPRGIVTYVPVTSVETVRTYPVELLAKYHFENGSRWTPFLGAGMRYVGAPNVPSSTFGIVPTPVPGAPGVISLDNGSHFGTRMSAEVAGGVALRLTPSVSLDLEGRRLLRSDGVAYDPVNRAVIGVSWRF